MSDYQTRWSLRPQNRSRFQKEPGFNFKFGERGSGLRAKGDVQDFYKIRDQCRADGVLFEDPIFPPTNASISYNQSPGKAFEWKRPKELMKNPRFFVEGASRFDVVQGDLGDCWMLAAVANLTLHPNIFHRVVPEDQSFRDENYAGIFHFRFWQYGKWMDVVVDDRLPTVLGHLVFLHSQTQNEFWSALLEKAYAKLYGSYEALKGGSTQEAMEDFTGGITEYYLLNGAPNNLFTILLKAYERKTLMGCSLKTEKGDNSVVTLPNGLVRGHAYSITAVKLVDIKTPRTSGKIPLLRLRNPWGQTEWNGPWSDKSREWQFISSEVKEKLGLVFLSDGEFWMSHGDFMKNFFTLELCNLNPESMEEELLSEKPTRRWETNTFEGSWMKGITAGGCPKYKETFFSNPQYRIVLDDPDEDDEQSFCTLIVALMQKNRRAYRKMGLDTLVIGFSIFKIEDPEKAPRPLNANFFAKNSWDRMSQFMNIREVSGRFKLAPGTYCIVPSTFDPNHEGEFLLRVFSEKKSDMVEFDDSIGEGEIDKRVERPDLDAAKQASLRESFQRIAGKDLEVDAYELKSILDFVLRKEFHFDGFGINLCRGMVAMMDADRSGKLGMEEFKELWFSIVTWKNVFKLYDKENTGSMNTFQLRTALESAGYHLNRTVMNVLALRHCNKNNTISFEDFIMCAIKLKHMIELYRDKDKAKNNKAIFTLEEWVESAMYA